MGTVGVKLGTNLYGKGVEKPTATMNQESNLQPGDLKKLNGDDVGDVLNKISDPNWVDPKKKMRAVGNDKLDKDAFFKLMLAQMKNQDPTNPLKPHEMSAQLASFSSLEQMTNINRSLEEMKGQQKPTEQFQALSLIGKGVAGDSAKIVRAKGDKEHDIRFNLPAAATETTMKIKNSIGDVVRTYKLNNLKEGENNLAWNGLDEQGKATNVDEYQVEIEAKDSSGKKLAVKTDFEGVISGVNYTPEGPVLMVGKQTVRLRDLRKIVDPSLMRNDQNVQNVVPQDLKEGIATTQTKQESNAGAAETPATQNMMESVGLSRELMGRLQKETADGG